MYNLIDSITLFLGAKKDDCGKCTGGTTGLEYNYLKKADCAGTCGYYKLDECNVCQNAKFEKSFKDCNGVCFGGAFINTCGLCTGGSTNKGINVGKDVCGVCGGDTRTCLGCDNVPNSRKIRDSCGKCLLKTDEDFDSGCFALSSFSPTFARHSGGETITVNGAKLNDLPAGCVLQGNGYQYEITPTGISKICRKLMI